jgi:hypothetical protein
MDSAWHGESWRYHDLAAKRLINAVVSMGRCNTI